MNLGDLATAGKFESLDALWNKFDDGIGVAPDAVQAISVVTSKPREVVRTVMGEAAILDSEKEIETGFTWSLVGAVLITAIMVSLPMGLFVLVNQPPPPPAKISVPFELKGLSVLFVPVKPLPKGDAPLLPRNLTLTGVPKHRKDKSAFSMDVLVLDLVDAKEPVAKIAIPPNVLADLTAALARFDLYIVQNVPR